jgi:serine/threonine protein kinase
MCSGRLLTPPLPLPVAGSTSQPNLVAITTSLRQGASASPTRSSFVNGTVDFGSVEEVDAALDRRADELDHVAPVGCRAVAEAHAHAAEADFRNFQVPSQRALFHGSSSRLERDLRVRLRPREKHPTALGFRAMSPDPIPTVDGRYRIERELGRGGMATVYLAEDTKHGRMSRSRSCAPRPPQAIGAERFRREIEILARLHHPHIVALHDSGATGDQLWYVMPHVEGESLRARLQRESKLPPAEATRLAREIAGALGPRAPAGDRAQRRQARERAPGRRPRPGRGLRHRAPRVAGRRRHRVRHHRGNGARNAALHGARADRRRTVDARTDLYALACVLYEMLTGAPPFTGPLEDVARRHLAEEPLPAQGVPSALAEFLTRGLAKAPAERFDTAAQFVEALLAASAGGAAVRPPATCRWSAAPVRSAARASSPPAAHCSRKRASSRSSRRRHGGKRGLRSAWPRNTSRRGPVFWVEPAPVADAGRVVEAVARRSRARDPKAGSSRDLVAERLRLPSAWLVLDNCEHVHDAVTG